MRAARAARRFFLELARRRCRRAFSCQASAGRGGAVSEAADEDFEREAASGIWRRGSGLVTAFLHSGSAKGQFTRSLAELLFAHHWAAQSKLRRVRGRLDPESMRRAMKSARLRLPAGGAEWVAVMHGVFPIPQRGGPSQLRASALTLVTSCVGASSYAEFM